MSQSKTIRLTIRSQNPFHDIRLSDSDLNLITKGMGELEADVPPGLYSVSYRLGDSYSEELIKLNSDINSKYVEAPQVAIAAQMPIAQTTQSDLEFFDLRIDHTRELSERDPVKIGEGARLFVFTHLQRSPMDLQMQQTEEKSILDGFLLLDLEEKIIFDFGKLPQNATIDELINVYAGINIMLDPGLYLFTYQSGKNRILQTLYLPQNWTTRLFLDNDPGGFNLSETTLFIDDFYQSYNPNRYDLMPTNLALESLRNQSVQVPGGDLRNMLFGKFENPALGIYWAHLAIRNEKASPQLIAEVIKNSQKLVKDHPDVWALFLWLQGNHPEEAAKIADEFEKRPTFTVPPMLRSSWNILLEVSWSEWKLIPPNSISEEAGDKVWGSGPWMMWEELVEVEPDEPSSAPPTRKKSRPAIKDIFPTTRVPSKSMDFEPLQMSQFEVEEKISDFLQTRAFPSTEMELPASREDVADGLFMQFMRLMADPSIYEGNNRWFRRVEPAGQRAMQFISSEAVGALTNILSGYRSEFRSPAIQSLNELLEMERKEAFALVISVWLHQDATKFQQWLMNCGFPEETCQRIQVSLIQQLNSLFTINYIARGIHMPVPTVTSGLLDLVQEIGTARKNGEL